MLFFQTTSPLTVIVVVAVLVVAESAHFSAKARMLKSSEGIKEHTVQLFGAIVIDHLEISLWQIIGVSAVLPCPVATAEPVAISCPHCLWQQAAVGTKNCDDYLQHQHQHGRDWSILWLPHLGFIIIIMRRHQRHDHDLSNHDENDGPTNPREDKNQCCSCGSMWLL